MAYLVTGGTGFVGLRIVQQLAKGGDQVVAYDLIPDITALDKLCTPEERQKVNVVAGDVTDLPHLLQTIKDNAIDTVIHTVSLLSQASNANPSQALRINSGGTINVFETARIMELKKVVWASSVAVFGAAERYSEEYIPNDAPHYPWGIYGATKSFNENIASHYIEQYGIDIIGIRYSLLYGPGQTPRGGVPGLITREIALNPAAGKPGRVPYGDDTIGWLYVDDAARATVMAARTARTKTRAFSTMGELKSVKDVAEYIRKLIPGADITLLPGCFGLAWKFETAPLEKEIGFRPQWTVEQGFREIINTFRREHGLPEILDAN